MASPDILEAKAPSVLITDPQDIKNSSVDTIVEGNKEQEALAADNTLLVSIWRFQLATFTNWMPGNFGI